MPGTADAAAIVVDEVLAARLSPADGYRCQSVVGTAVEGFRAMTSLPALLIAIVDVLSVVLVALSARGVIKRNTIAGIRTGLTRRSEAAWENAHRAGLIPITVGAAVSLALAIATIVISRDIGVAWLLLGLAIVTLLAGSIWGVARARRAAAATD